MPRVCVVSWFSHVQLFATLWTIACQAPLSTGFSRQEYWSRLPFPPPGDLADPGTKPAFLMSPALADRFFTIQFSSVQSLSCVRLPATPRIKACQASLSITNSRSSPKVMCILSAMPFSHLILCRPLLLLPPIPPSISVFSNESTLHIK